MIVTDASVWLSYLVQDDVHYAVTRPWLDARLVQREPLAAPILLLAEVGGALARRLDNTALALQTIEQLLAIPTLRLVSIDHALGIDMSRLAAQYRLRGADACYVAVTARLGVPLVSWDQEQLNRTAGLITAYAPMIET